MKKRNIIILCVVALVGIVAAIVAVRGSRKSTFKQDYHVADTSTVEKLYLADKQGNSVTLTRGSDSLWIVNDTFVANQAMVDLLLETLNTMRIRQQVNHSAMPHVVNDIAAHSIKTEVYQRAYRIDWFHHHLRLFPHRKLAVTYYVGRETQDMMASYMFREGDEKPYIIHIPGFRGFLTPRFVTEPTKWRSHRIVALSSHAIERVELEITASEDQSFAIVRDGEGFRMELTHPQRPVDGFDTARVAQMLACFANLNFDEFADIVPNTSDSSLAGAPGTILTITDTAGRSRELRTYIKYTPADVLADVPDARDYNEFDVNRLYAVIDRTDTVLIQYYIFDNILQPASYFMGQDKDYLVR